MRKKIQAIKWCGYDLAFCKGKAWAFNFNGTKEVGPIGCFKNINEAAKHLVRNELGGCVPNDFPYKDNKTELSDDLRRVVENDLREIEEA